MELALNTLRDAVGSSTQWYVFMEAGFRETWKSHGILKWSFPGLEKSWRKLKSQKF